jgi:4-amino-4-deoxy-L-arabinose transferase-like glycosyltransferase
MGADWEALLSSARHRISGLWTRVQPILMLNRSLRSVCAIVVVLLIAALGMSLALQGWRSQILAFDMVEFFEAANDLLTRGILPKYGDVSSYASFSPPGAAWLMMPGMLVFEDPRLFEKLGSGFLHFGTLICVFLLGRMYFGGRCAVLSVLLYGLSGIGLSFAGSLWAIGHPFFYVWMAYCVTQWVTNSDAKHLAMAIVIYAAGMYMDMTIAPALFILPSAWLLYRPPLRFWPLVLAGAVSLLIWFPYLQFEADRGFVDIKSQVQRRSIFPVNYKDAWCDSSLALQEWNNTSSTLVSDSRPVAISQNNSPDFIRPLLVRANVVLNGLLANFDEVAAVPGTSIPLLFLVLGTLIVLPLIGSSRRVMARITSKSQIEHRQQAGLLVVSVLCPWLILLLVAEPGRSERFLWLWPLQVIVLAGLVTYVFKRLKVPRSIVWITQLALITIVIGSPLLTGAKSWYRTGWSGQDATEIVVADYIAEQVRSEGLNRAAIGYHVYIYPFMATYNIVNPLYKVGKEFDLWFKYRHGIANTNQCAEGLSPGDEYRIVQTRRKSGDEEPKHYFEVPSEESFRLIRSFGLYQVLKRSQGPQSNAMISRTFESRAAIAPTN